ncbi:MAG TPA: chemotaxis protein CheA [Burkholderiales bacterium]|nr:chemotaxis protein CheA [Burkholderiales bacterium]
MSDFAGNEELLQDFLTEASELLADVDNKLVELEKRPADHGLLKEIFRSFHTIKGGAGFLGATELVKLCHVTENLFDRLRNGEITLNPAMMDSILAATAGVRCMFDNLSQRVQPRGADAGLLAALQAVADDTAAPAPSAAPAQQSAQPAREPAHQPDWPALYGTLVAPTAAGAKIVPAATPQPAFPAHGRRAADDPAVETARAGRRESDKVAVAKETTIRIDTARLDQVLNLSGEIGLTKNRLNCLRSEMLGGKTDAATVRALDEAVSQLDLLVGDLQNAVMKTRMQPVGRLFQKYPRLARDLARQLEKDVELEISGEETELDRTMIDELADPLVHLVRNAVDHGIETPEERKAQGKPPRGTVRLSAQQAGDHIIIEICDDGRGMRADALRRKAMEKGLVDAETANGLDDRHSLQLIFLPGFSTKDEISNVSGRGVGMDVVKTNIQKLNGRIEISSVPGAGSKISISLPLTLAILPVLVVRLGEQPFAVPLAMVREIIPLDAAQVQSVSGKATMVVRDEVLPLRSLAGLLGWPAESAPSYGVLLHATTSSLVLAVDGFVGRDDVVIKPLEGLRPKGVAGATLAGDGSVVLVLDMEELLAVQSPESRTALFAKAA